MSSSSMQCPKCGNRRNIVYDSRVVQSDKCIRRRRKCESCGFKWVTLEYPEQIYLNTKTLMSWIATISETHELTK